MGTEISEKEELRYAELQGMALDFARNGDTEDLEKMIIHGMNVNLCTNKDDSLLMLASYNGNYETTEMLLKYNATIDKVNQRGQTPLEGVCFKGNLEMVNLLVNNNCIVSKNAIIYATIFGNIEIVKYLKRYNSNNFKEKILGVKVEIIAAIISKTKNIFN